MVAYGTERKVGMSRGLCVLEQDILPYLLLFIQECKWVPVVSGEIIQYKQYLYSAEFQKVFSNALSNITVQKDRSLVPS